MELQITSIFAIIAISAIIALASNVMTEKSAPKPPPISEFKSFSSKIKTSSKPEIINLLVIDEVSTNNWYKLFQKQKLSDGTPIRVEQCGWQDIDIYVEDISSGKGRAICNLSATSSPIFGTPQNTNRFAMVSKLIALERFLQILFLLETLRDEEDRIFVIYFMDFILQIFQV